MVNKTLLLWISLLFGLSIVLFTLAPNADGPACEQCPTPASRCEGLKIQTCTNITGCANWSIAVDCPSGESCNATMNLCAKINISCVNNCTAGKTRCNENKLETCTPDSAGCLNWSLPKHCDPDYYCPATAPVCVLGCSSDDDCSPGKLCKLKTKLCKKASALTPINETGQFITPPESQIPATPVIVKERVVCVFKGAIGEQNCSSSKGSCKGKMRCNVDITGEKWEYVAWNSSCGAPIKTRVTGTFKKINFMCVHKCSDSDGGTILDVTGKTCASGYCEEDFCLDEKTLVEKFCASSRNIGYDIYDCRYGCRDNACASTILAASKAQTKPVLSPQMKKGKPQLVKIPKVGLRKRSLFRQSVPEQR